jgi:hypothetical protein
MVPCQFFVETFCTLKDRFLNRYCCFSTYYFNGPTSGHIAYGKVMHGFTTDRDLPMVVLRQNHDAVLVNPNQRVAVPPTHAGMNAQVSNIPCRSLQKILLHLGPQRWWCQHLHICPKAHDVANQFPVIGVRKRQHITAIRLK